MSLSENLAAELGLSVIREWLYQRAHCSKTRDMIRDNTPDTFLPGVTGLLDLTDDLVQAAERQESVPMSDFPDISSWISTLNIEGHILKTKEFRDLYRVLQLGREVKCTIRQHDYPHWMLYNEAFFQLPEGEKKILAVFDEEYQVKSSASPELTRIRQKIRSAEAGLHKQMDSIFQDSRKGKWLQGDRIVWREGRLVLPIASSHKRKISGIIHGRSATGQTVFIEPMEIVEKSNELMELRSDEKAEIHRILRQLSGFFRPYTTAIADGFTMLVKFDLHYTFSRMADILNCIRPEFQDNGQLHIRNGRNPLLELSGKEVIPLSLELEKNNRILLLSGPNAGGKTVVLKTVGLFSVMAQSGMFIPADTAKLPFFTRIITDIGDQQSMEDDLSTFSAHIRNLKTVVEEADRHTLVLLDELGTGTDPDAGSAISQAILEHLHKRGSCMIATTHLGSLKLWAHETEGIVNGGMRFDPDKLQPTYELNVGQPGASYAIEISNRMGLPKTVIDRAQTLLGSSSVALEDLLNKLEQERLSAEKTNLQVQERSRKLAVREREIEITRVEIRRIRKNALRDARREAEELVRETRRNMENTISRIRTSNAGKEIIRKSRTNVQNQLNRLKNQEKKLTEPVQNHLSVAEARQDLKVYIPHLEESGTIIQTPGKNGKTTVLVNGIRLMVHVSKLQAMDHTPEIPPPEKVNTGKHHVSIPDKMQIDLRGMRVNEAVLDLERFLDGCLISGLPVIHILHGKGTGALQEAVKEYLKDQAFVKSFGYARPDQGGAGVTIVHF